MSDGEWTTAYCDTDLTFFLLTYRDHEVADLCLRDLRAHFPDSRVVVRADGDPDPRNLIFSERYGADVRREGRLFAAPNGAAVIARMFQIFLERPTAFLFKIDPDTVVHRRFRYLPTRDGIFGTLQGGEVCPSIQGGCLGFSLRSAERIAGSEALEDPRLSDPMRYRETSGYFRRMANRAERCGLASFDWALGWIAGEVSVPMFDFPEVHSRWKEPTANADLRYAVTHPRPR